MGFMHDVKTWGVRVAWWNFRFSLGYRIGGFTHARRVKGLPKVERWHEEFVSSDG